MKNPELMVNPAAWKGNKQTTTRLLAEAFDPISGEMSRLSDEIHTFINVETKTASEFLNHVFFSAGKRIRPAFYFLCAKLVGYKGQHLIPMGAVCEFIHIASLLHDDVVDDATMRRGKPTGNSIWGDEVAVLMGDLIYSRASEMMAATGNLEIVKTFARAIRKMSEGEILQLENLQNFEISHEDYFKILERKTGVLIGSACKTAGLLADVGEEKCQALYNFGMNVGIAFQLIDDALDYVSSSDVLGKTQFTDLSEGKLTYPMINLRDKVDPSELENVKELFQLEKQEDSFKELVSLINKYETPKSTLELAHKYTNDAIRYLDIFDETPERVWLQSLAEFLTQRYF